MNLIRHRSKVLGASLMIIVVVITTILVINPFKKDIWEINAESFRNSFNVISGTTIIDDLSQWGGFEWDMLYSFAPYTAKDKIYEVVGYKWDNITATVSEDMNQLVFIKDDKVVCYLYGYPENTKLGFDFGEYEGSYIKLRAESISVEIREGII